MEKLGDLLETLFEAQRLAEEPEASRCSYSLRLVLSTIDTVSKQFPDLKIETKTNFPVIFTYTGVALSFEGIDWGLSIQTRPEVTGPAFCESALLNKTKPGVSYESELGYWDVIRHDDPEALRVHLVDMFKRLPTFKSTDS
jgi:hypothetical protein